MTVHTNSSTATVSDPQVRGSKWHLLHLNMPDFFTNYIRTAELELGSM